MVFVDTGAWFAWFVPDDPGHILVADWIDAATEPLITTDYCVDETLTLLLARKRASAAVESGKFFFHTRLVTLEFIAAEQVHRAWILFQQRAAVGWSFTDCTSKIVIDDLGIKTLLALDDHFRQLGLDVHP